MARSLADRKSEYENSARTKEVKRNGLQPGDPFDIDQSILSPNFQNFWFYNRLLSQLAPSKKEFSLKEATSIQTNRSPFPDKNQAISLTLINEYTDWSAGGGEQNFIDSLIDILGDALVVAPLTNAVNLHLKLAGQKSRQTANNVYSYVFVYQVGLLNCFCFAFLLFGLHFEKPNRLTWGFWKCLFSICVFCIGSS